MKEITVGDRLRHPSRADWGLGQVLKVSGPSAVIYFDGVGEKTIRLDYVELQKVTDGEAKSILLDSMPKSKRIPKRAHFSLHHLIDLFEQKFPGGFHGEEFTALERNYKMAGHQLATDRLNEHELRKLFGASDYTEICARSRRILSKLNLVSPFEIIKLNAGMKGNEEIFATGLLELLYGTNEFSDRFDAFCDVLSKVDGAKWPVVTYYPFILFPTDHMFLKPGVTQAAADACRFEIMYRPEINSRTYAKLLDFSHYLFDQLSELKPRDMIDVQSFVWCVEQVSRGEY